MIYSKFGTALSLVSKAKDASGRVTVQATTRAVVHGLTVGEAEIHEYNLADLKADDGITEINATIEKLPMKVFENTSGRRRKPM